MLPALTGIANTLGGVRPRPGRPPSAAGAGWGREGRVRAGLCEASVCHLRIYAKPHARRVLNTSLPKQDPGKFFPVRPPEGTENETDSLRIRPFPSLGAHGVFWDWPLAIPGAPAPAGIFLLCLRLPLQSDVFVVQLLEGLAVHAAGSGHRGSTDVWDPTEVRTPTCPCRISRG